MSFKVGRLKWNFEDQMDFEVTLMLKYLKCIESKMLKYLKKDQSSQS